MADAKSTCGHCAAELPEQQPGPGRPRRYCSQRCGDKARWQARERHPPKGRAPRATCPGCGNRYAQRLSGGQRMQHCSRRCAEAVSKAETERKATLVAEIAAIRRLGKGTWKPRPIQRRHCAGCGQTMIFRELKGCPQKRCGPCSVEAKAAQRRAGRTQRRARERALPRESIDPLAVFARDGWCCRLCGRSTPPNERGTYADEAPELDHIVPLARGGHHVWSNVQCACRQCNNVKGMRLEYELEAA